MIIRSEQFEVFDKQQLDQFRNNCLDFMSDSFPEYCEEHGRGFQLKLIDEMIAFGNHFNICKPKNIQKLIALQVKYNFFKESLPPNLSKTVNHELREEDDKINQLHKYLIHNFNR